MDHSVFTIVAPVIPGRHDELVLVLGGIGPDPSANPTLPLGAVPGLHFASLTIHDAGPGGPELIFELNVDGSVAEHLPQLVKGVRPGLDAVFGCCTGWSVTADDAAAVGYLRRHVVDAGAFHVGNTGRSVDRIQQEARLWQAVQGHLDDLRRDDTLPGAPSQIRQAVVDFVAARPDLAWALVAPAPNLTTKELADRKAAKATFFAAAIGAAVVLLPVTLIGAGYLLVRECLDKPDDRDADPELVALLEAFEDLDGHVQNHLTSVIPIKPGWFRLNLLKLVLRAIETLARTDFTRGSLGGISSIHFAHWSIIDDGQTLLFVSNFDGSWESYLDDFIELAHIGLTAVWSNGVGFPRTHFLVTEGATHGLQFKHWARRSQKLTPVWYSAYPTLGVTGIDANSALRRGLSGSPQPEEVQTWVRQL